MNVFLLLLMAGALLLGFLLMYFGYRGKAQIEADQETDTINQAYGDDSFFWFATGCVVLMVDAVVFAFYLVASAAGWLG